MRRAPIRRPPPLVTAPLAAPGKPSAKAFFPPRCDHRSPAFLGERIVITRITSLASVPERAADPVRCFVGRLHSSSDCLGTTREKKKIRDGPPVVSPRNWKKNHRRRGNSRNLARPGIKPAPAPPGQLLPERFVPGVSRSRIVGRGRFQLSEAVLSRRIVCRPGRACCRRTCSSAGGEARDANRRRPVVSGRRANLLAKRARKAVGTQTASPIPQARGFFRREDNPG